MEDFLILGIIAVCLSLAHCVSIIKDPNPFNRRFKKPYRVDSSGICLYSGAGCNDLDYAISEFFYLYPSASQISLISPEEYGINFFMNMFLNHPSIKCLNLSSFYPKNTDFNLDGFIEVLTVPKNTRMIHFSTTCDELEQLIIPCDSFVPAFQLYDEKITVKENFCIQVPQDLLHMYLENDNWNRLRFTSASGSPVSLKFVSAPILGK